MGDRARVIAEALSGLDPITVRIIVLAFFGTIIVMAAIAAHVLCKAIAKAKAARFGKGELELQFHDTTTDG
jgi:hypothetical protein